MPRANDPAADHLATARTQEARLVIAVLDPDSTETNSPLRRALASHPRPALTAPPTSQKEA